MCRTRWHWRRPTVLLHLPLFLVSLWFGDMEDRAAASPAPLEIHLFGRFAVRVRGHVLPETAIKGRKARALLKLIALQRQARIPREQVMDELWPQLDASAAASQLYKALHHIRKAVSTESDEADEWIEITDDLIRLVPPGGVVVDVHRFEETARSGLRDRRIQDMEQAVSIYAGDLLPMDRYAEWASVPREHYRQLYLDVLTTLAAQYEQRGELSKAAQMARLALEKDPALESAHRALMRIFARQGQSTRAFRQYDTCREILQNELGMGPSPETKEVLEAVQEQQLAKDPAPSPVRSRTPEPLPPLVNRARECTQIDHLLDRLAAGDGGTLIISGEVGLGKTRLVREVARRSRQRNMRVFSAGAAEGKSAVSYAPFVELFEVILRDETELQDLLPAELGQLVPSFSGDGAPIPHADQFAAQGYLFAQVQRFFARLVADGPTVLVLEDLHAADEGSRELFGYLTRHASDLPLVLSATTREEDVVPVPAGSPSGSENTVVFLELDPLTSEEHASLIQQHSGPSDVSSDAAERIFQLSEGNPLFALELLQYEKSEEGEVPSEDELGVGDEVFASRFEGVPSSLSYVVEDHITDLSSMARHVLYVAAVIGRQVEFDLLASVWQQVASADQEALFEPLEEVTRAGLLAERGLDYAFRHALVREVIYASISEARRRDLHERVAQQLVAGASGSDEEPVEEIAHHFVRAGDVRQGVRYLVRAAERAEAAYAHEDALERYGEALSVLEDQEDTQSRRLRQDVLERLGDEYRASGRVEQSYDAYEEAVALAEDVPLSTPNLVELHRKIAVVAIFRTDLERSEQHLDEAFDLVGEDERAQVRLLITKALHLWHLNELEKAYEFGREALTLAETVDAPAEMSQAREILAMTCLPLGRWEEGVEYERQRQIPGWSPEIVVATDAHLCLWEYHMTGDQPFQKARSFVQSVAEQATEIGDLRCLAICHYALGTMHLWRGEHEEAVHELEESLELHERIGSPAGKAYVLARQGVLHTMQGAMDIGWQAVQDGIRHAERAAVRDHCLQRLYGVGIWNRLEASDLQGARDLVEKSRELLEDMGACAACALDLYPWLAYFYLDAGDISEARACRDAVSTLAEQTGNPIGEAAGAMIESNLLVAEEKEDQANQRRREAFDLVTEAIREATQSPVAHYLDRMVDQQADLRKV